MYIKINNGNIEKYPYSIGELRRDNPNTSFPRSPSEALLAEWGVFPVTSVPAPQIDHTQNCQEGTPVYNNGWQQTWNVVSASPGDIEQRTQDRARDHRSRRDQRLASTDWTQVQDSPVDREAWAQYRQALRDIPQQPGFPWTVDWPTSPDGTLIDQ